MSYLSTIFGTPFRVTPDAIAIHRFQYRFPRTKNRRIRKKWAKREGNYREVGEPAIFQTSQQLLIHPVIYEALIQRQKGVETNRLDIRSLFGALITPPT